ncbi:hypothetical protein PRIPAC_76390, partial [Pristionchus pacificus]
RRRRIHGWSRLVDVGERGQERVRRRIRSDDGDEYAGFVHLRQAVDDDGVRRQARLRRRNVRLWGRLSAADDVRIRRLRLALDHGIRKARVWIGSLIRRQVHLRRRHGLPAAAAAAGCKQRVRRRRDRRRIRSLRQPGRRIRQCGCTGSATTAADVVHLRRRSRTDPDVEHLRRWHDCWHDQQVLIVALEEAYGSRSRVR